MIFIAAIYSLIIKQKLFSIVMKAETNIINRELSGGASSFKTNR